MSKAVNEGSEYLKSNGHSSKKVTSKQDVRRQRAVHPSPLQKKLEEHLQKSKKQNGKSRVITSQPNGIARYTNESAKRHKSDQRPLFSMESDSDDDLTVTQYSKSPNVSVTHNSKGLAECEERLLKDGYRLDEMSDEEDLDLIPPRPADNKCQCCSTLTAQGCIIS